MEYLYITRWKKHHAMYALSLNNVLLAFVAYQILQPTYLDQFGGATVYIITTLLTLVSQALIIAPDFIFNSIVVILVNFIKAASVYYLHRNPFAVALILVSFYICYTNYIQEKAKRQLFLQIQKNSAWDETITAMLNEKILITKFDQDNLSFILKNKNNIAVNESITISDNASLRNFLRKIMLMNEKKTLEEVLMETMKSKIFQENMTNIRQLQCFYENNKNFFEIHVHYQNFDEKLFIITLDNKGKKKDLEFYIQKSQKLLDLFRASIKNRVVQLKCQITELKKHYNTSQRKDEIQNLISELTMQYYQSCMLKIRAANKIIVIKKFQQISFIWIMQYSLRIMKHQAIQKKIQICFSAEHHVYSQKITTNKFILLVTLLNILKYSIERCKSKIIKVQVNYAKRGQMFYFDVIIRIDDFLNDKENRIPSFTRLAYQQAKLLIQYLGPFNQIRGIIYYLNYHQKRIHLYSLHATKIFNQ